MRIPQVRFLTFRVLFECRNFRLERAKEHLESKVCILVKSVYLEENLYSNGSCSKQKWKPAGFEVLGSFYRYFPVETFYYVGFKHFFISRTNSEKFE